MNSPVINFQKQNNLLASTHPNTALPSIKIDHIEMRDPVINLEIGQDLYRKKISLPYSKGNSIKADGIQIASGGIKLDALNIHSRKAQVTGREKAFSVDNGIDLNLSKINISTGDSTEWNAMLTKLNIKNSVGYEFNIKENKLFLKDIKVENCKLSSASIKNIGLLLSSNQNATISTSSAKYFTKNSIWQINNMSFDAGLQLLMLDSVNYEPAMSRDSFIASNPYQIDYMTFRSGNIKLYGFDLNKYVNKNILYIQNATVSQPNLTVFRDKFPPFREGITKEMFTEKIRSITFPVSINQININDGQISYTEKNEKNRLEGNLLLTNLNGNIFNIKNHDNKAIDSLSLALTGRMLGQAFFDLKLNQSYTDSTKGFIMALSIEPASLLFLNPLLMPLSNIKFTSGSIDKFQMTANGDETSAQGEMKFYYHDMKIRILKNGGLEKAGFIKNAGSALVNFFILKNNNTSRTGLIYFKRLQDRSFFNYMNKIIFSGVITSTGAKKNSRYKKEIRKINPAK